ncbi:hypothetical protein NDU88_003035 [Pleurodeles waltl]|uniref:Uncharacterized protein n=1 Tax=Pleurodeles waltl TaxID=8319 RepID=A0AAV7RDQ2_PLEWA|nr:hypothetical protein NDU88_003035 [Pleurodeles waltl]
MQPYFPKRRKKQGQCCDRKFDPRATGSMQSRAGTMQPHFLRGINAVSAIHQKFPRISHQIDAAPVTSSRKPRISMHHPQGVRKPRNPKRIQVYAPEIDAKRAVH